MKRYCEWARENVNREMSARGISEKRLAESAGVPVVEIQNFLSGREPNPGLQWLEKIGGALNLSGVVLLAESPTDSVAAAFETVTKALEEINEKSLAAMLKPAQQAWRKNR